MTSERRKFFQESLNLRRTRVLLVWTFVATAAFVIGLVAYGSSVYGFLVDVQQGQSSPGAAAQPALVIGVARTPGGPRAWVGYARAMAEIQRVVGPVKVRYIPDHEEAYRAMRYGQVDAMFTCNTAFIRLTKDRAAEPLASPIIDGTPRDAAVLVVAASSPYRSLEDLRGRRVAIVSSSSLSGHAYLDFLMQSHGLTASEYFSEVVSGSSQEHNLTDILNGRTDATVVNRSQLASFDKKQFRVLEKSGEFMLAPFVVRTTMAPETKQKVRQALLGFHRRPDMTKGDVLEGFAPYDWSGFDVLQGFYQVLVARRNTEAR